MIRKFLFIAITVAMALSLFACGDNDSDESTITQSPSPQITESPPPPTVEPTFSPAETQEPTQPATETPAASQNEIELTLGQTWTYVFFENGSEFGFNECEVMEVVTEGASVFYVIKSDLQLNPSASCKPTMAEAVARINQHDIPLAYNATASIGSG